MGDDAIDTTLLEELVAEARRVHPELRAWYAEVGEKLFVIDVKPGNRARVLEALRRLPDDAGQEVMIAAIDAVHPPAAHGDAGMSNRGDG